MTSDSFFDDYPQFYETSQTGAVAGRLNNRYAAIIEFNREILRGSRVLDIASHDGRWSFAALDAGAAHVTGIEIRSYLVENCVRNMQSLGIEENRYDFKVGDALNELDKLESGQFEVVMCLGFLYHTVHNPLLIERIGRLNPKYVIFDTQLGVPAGLHEPPEWLSVSHGIYGRFFMEKMTQFLSEQPIIFLHEDETMREGMAVNQACEDHLVPVGYPTKGALEFLLDKAGFENFTYFDWLHSELENAATCFDYRVGHRVTLRGCRKT